WPVFQTRQFDSSPSTQTSKNSCSSRSRMRTVSSVTVKTRRGSGPGAWGCGRGPGCDDSAGCGALAARGSGSGSSASSSNGGWKRSVIGQAGEILQFHEAEADALDVGRPAAGLVRLDHYGVQPRVGGGGVELLRQRGQKAGQGGLDLDADDRIVRPGHADV